MSCYAKKKHDKYSAMVLRVLGRRVDKMNPYYSTDSIGQIIAGIEANIELKELAKHGFCSCLPNGNSSEVHYVVAFIAPRSTRKRHPMISKNNFYINL